MAKINVTGLTDQYQKFQYELQKLLSDQIVKDLDMLVMEDSFSKMSSSALTATTAPDKLYIGLISNEFPMGTPLGKVTSKEVEGLGALEIRIPWECMDYGYPSGVSRFYLIGPVHEYQSVVEKSLVLRVECPLSEKNLLKDYGELISSLELKGLSFRILDKK